MYQEFSAIYEEKIKEDFNYEEMACFMLRQLKEAGITRHRALDMGCGTGNASMGLIRYFDEMVLCDPSSEMLNLADVKFPNPYRPMLLQANAAEFEMAGRFDFIFSVLDIPNYLDESEFAHYLENSWKNLKTKGLMIFDLSSVLKLREMADSGTFVYDDEDYFHVWENQLMDETLEMTINVFTRTPSNKGSSKADGLYKRITEEQTMYLHPAKTIEQMTVNAGFRIRGKYDGYTKVFATDETRRLVYVLEKGEL